MRTIPIVRPKLEWVGSLELEHEIPDVGLDIPSAAAIFTQLMRNSEQEELWEIGVTANHTPAFIVHLASGTADWVLSHKSRFLQSPLLAETLSEPVKRGVTGIVLGHNHFLTLEPSSADDGLTRQISRAAQVVGLVLVDHIIVCPAMPELEGKHYSFYEAGRIYLTEDVT